MNVIQRQPARTGFWAVLLLSVLAWAPATFPGYWQSLDGFVPVFNATSPNAIANIATASDLWRGIGSGTFLLVRPLIVLGLGPVAAVRVTFALCLLLGGLGIYVWLCPRLGDRGAGLAGAVYMLLPSFLATVYIRGSLSDALMLGLLPLALAGIAIHAQSRSMSAAILVVITLLWMWRTQAGLAILATCFLLLYSLWVERQWVTVWVVLLSGAAGLTSLIPLWAVTAPSPVNFQDHFVFLFQLFASNWQVAPSLPGWQDAYPFQLGFAAVSFSALTLWLWQVAPHSRQKIRWQADWLGRLLGFSFIGTVILIILSLSMSEPLWRLSHAERLITYPWQILLLAGPLLAVTAGSLPVLHSEFNANAYWSILLTLVVLSSYPYLSTTFTQVTPPDAPVAVIGGNDNFVLLSANLTEHKQPRTATLEVTWQVLQPIGFDNNVFFQALTGDDDSPVVVAQLDRQPCDGKCLMTSWQPGKILTDTYQLDLTKAAQTPNLRYYFGYYDWRDGKRLPVDGGINDKLVFHGQ
ncbi:MAG: hypothetical protein NT075_32520 [Chloroflexi bacterium]|nr:hypothetical protein [Chloroflexota bacterium]